METSSSFGSSVNSLTSSSYVLLLCSSAFRDRSRRMRRTYRRRRIKSRIRTRRTNGIARKTGSAFRIRAKRDAPTEARWRNQEAAAEMCIRDRYLPGALLALVGIGITTGMVKSGCRITTVRDLAVGMAGYILSGFLIGSAYRLFRELMPGRGILLFLLSRCV